MHIVSINPIRSSDSPIKFTDDESDDVFCRRLPTQNIFHRCDRESAVPRRSIAIKLERLRLLHPLRIRTHPIQLFALIGINDEIRAKHV
jgi:hypothetical protein